MTSFRFLFALLLAGLASTTRPALAQRPGWTQVLQVFNGRLSTRSVHTTDRAGNTYQLNEFTGRAILGGDTLNATVPDSVGQGNDVVLIKYTPTGQVAWYRFFRAYRSTADPAASVYGWSVVLDKRQNVTVAIFHADTLDLAGTQVLGQGTLLAKYSPTGTRLWLHEVVVRGGPGQGGATAGVGVLFPFWIATDTAGRFYFATNARNVRAVDGIRVDSSIVYPQKMGLVGGCDSMGRVQWAQSIVPTSTTFIPERPNMMNLAVDAAGNMLATGIFKGDIRFGAGPSAPHLTSNRGFRDNGFLALYGPTGNLRRTQILDGFVESTTTDPAGNFYVAGFSDSISWRLGTTVNSAPGTFVAKLSPAATPVWISRPTQLPGATDGPYVTPSAITADAAGNTLIGGQCYQPTTFGEYELAYGAYAARLNPQGAVEWAVPIIRAGQTMQTVMAISQDAAGQVYVSGISGGDITGKNISFVQQLSPQTTRLTGRAYFDTDADGQRDPGEGVFPRLLVVENQGEAVATAGDPTGRFHVFADTGRYDLRLPVVPPHYQLSQGSGGYQSRFSAYGQADSARHFGIAPIANQADVRVSLTPYTGARRGFVNRYQVRVENIGTVAASGQVSVQLDPRLNYLGAAPTPAQQTGNAVTWNFSGLAPFGTADFEVSANIPLNVALGTVIESRAAGTVPNDFDPTNDVDSTRQTVVGSWDPNALAVNYSTLTLAQIRAGVELDYIIHFQNLGTDTAFTVVITDTLAAHLLQLGTLYVVSQSHNCRVDLLGNRQLVIRFDQINLPPTSVSALGAGGFIRFRVRPRPTLTPGALIPNTAHIVFDYNAPLATNEVTTLVQAPNGLVAEAGVPAAWSLYPNPATDGVTLTADLPASGPVAVLIVDALGRPVRRETTADAPAGPWTRRVPTAGLAPGVYAVRLMLPGGGTASRRLVVR